LQGVATVNNACEARVEEISGFTTSLRCTKPIKGGSEWVYNHVFPSVHCGDRTGVIVKPDRETLILWKAAEMKHAVSVDGTMDTDVMIDGKCVRDFVACPRATSLSERQKAEVREYANVDGLLRSLQYINSRNDTADAED
jgi:hypothetical protein